MKNVYSGSCAYPGPQPKIVPLLENKTCREAFRRVL